MLRFIGTTLVLLTLVGVAGCGDPNLSKRAKVFKVTGKISKGGSALSGVSVTYSPKDAGCPAAFARTDDNGEFVVTTYSTGDGAAPGKYAVTLLKPAPVETVTEDKGHSATGSPTDASHSAGGGKAQASSIPEAYSKAETTPLLVQVLDDDQNRHELEVK